MSVQSQFVINLLFDPSVLNAPNAAQIEAAATSAAQQLEACFSDPITLNLHVGWGEVENQALDSGSLGQSSFSLLSYTYQQLRTVLPSLPATSPTGSNSVLLTPANQDALGLGFSNTADGYVGFGAASGLFSFNGATPAFNQYVFNNVFDHEVTEVMGREAELGSGVSHSDYSLLDMYRFASPGVHTVNPLANSYFSADGGVTQGYAFNTDSNGDSGDWANSAPADAFAAFITGGQTNPMSSEDMAVMAALGWHPTSTTPFAAPITAAYDEWFGRDPSASELNVWSGLINSGYTENQLRAALLADPTGQGHTVAEIKSLYDTYFGRDPTASEVSVWQGLIAGGSDFNTLRSALISDPSGQAYIATEIKTLYDTYFGRDPTASEVSVWKGLIATGSDFNTLRAALLSDPSGVAHTNATVTALYDTYFGRDPTAGELAVWQNLIAGGATFTTLRSALLSDPAGVAHTNATVTGLYDTYFGRDPTASELSVWQGLIAGGATFTTLRSALLSDPTG
ncbi:MAG: NF038122 family metalloprotease, partial [Caulobacteraceae bacterium]|nr:NF038122 family metalloprotease [Caulobacteraceae bacterium]